MTAPDYVAQAAELLAEHSGWAETGPDVYGNWEAECFGCGTRLGDVDTLVAEWEAQTGERHMDHAHRGSHPANDRAHAAHQAEVLAAAGLIPTSTEWGVRMTWDGPKRVPRFRGVTVWKDATDD